MNERRIAAEQCGVHLSEKQWRLYLFMFDYKGRDVPITDMYTHMYRGAPDTIDFRQTQQRVGSLVSRINRGVKTLGEVIKPGELKRTYRLADAK